jgi:3-oxoacyl-[acyl-carrier protein] reductase
MSQAVSSPSAGGILAGQAALVTGAARGVGRATASLLIEHGARVLLADLDAAAADLAARELGPAAVPFAGDLTRPGIPAAAVAATIEAWGAIDIVVNNAGYNLNARLTDMTDEHWQRMLAVHGTAPFEVLRAAAPHLIEAAMQDRAAGREIFRKVVNVSSIAVMGSAFQANYAAGKAAVVGLTKSLAKEWGDYRINVNAVAFGSLDTRLTRPRDAANILTGDHEQIHLGMSARALEQAVGTIPFGRVGSAREAAGGVFLLCTPWSNWINGQLLMVTGGQAFGMSA